MPDLIEGRLNRGGRPENKAVEENRHLLFRAMWWATNLLFCVAVAALIYSSFREYAVRLYLDGFSDAIVPNNAPAEAKVEALLKWMRDGSTRLPGNEPKGLSLREPEVT